MCMKAITSTEFRKVYHTLHEETIVTVNGHPIGTWRPSAGAIILDQLPFDEATALLKEDGPLFLSGPPERFNTRPFTPVPKSAKRR